MSPSAKNEIQNRSHNNSQQAPEKTHSQAPSYEELLRHLERKKDVLRCANIVVWELDTDLNFTYLSDNAARVIGFENDDLLSKRLDDLFPKEPRASSLQIMQHFMAKHEHIRHVEQPILHKNGQVIWMTISGMPIFDADNQMIGYRGVCEDITHTRTQAKHLELAVAQNVVAEQMIFDFIRLLNYEIRTPLNDLVWLLNEPDIASSEAQKLWEILQHANNSMTQIKNQISDMGDYLAAVYETGANSEEQEIESINLAETIPNMMLPYQERAQHKKLAFHIQGLDNIPHRLGFRYAPFARIVTHLIDNAVTYTFEGSITCDFSYDENSKQLTLQIIDTGAGMEQNDADHALRHLDVKPSDDPRVRQGHKTGLGLPICAALSKHLGGKLTLSSQRRQGTTATLCFPVEITDHIPAQSPSQLSETFMTSTASSSAAPATLETQVDVQKTNHPLRILVAEDMMTNQMMMRQMLEQLGHKSDFVSNGVEVLHALHHGSYDLVLLDQIMPTMNGIDTMMRMRYHDRDDICQMPTYIVTADTLSLIKTDYKSYGFDGYLAKPFTVLEMAQLLKPHQNEDKTLQNTPPRQRPDRQEWLGFRRDLSSIDPKYIRKKLLSGQSVTPADITRVFGRIADLHRQLRGDLNKKSKNAVHATGQELSQLAKSYGLREIAEETRVFLQDYQANRQNPQEQAYLTEFSLMVARAKGQLSYYIEQIQ